MANDTFPSYIKPRVKGGRRDKPVTIDYQKVHVVGEYDGIFDYETKARGELLLAEVDGWLYPCYRRKAESPNITTAICHDYDFKRCRVEDAK
ncbi:hypothetical protein [Acinetobacter sp.]|uniref:hypothetical protein n=1 Tax=Acinetobacter sp. TaxID=472 RepID=UPI00388D92E7